MAPSTLALPRRPALAGGLLAAVIATFLAGLLGWGPFTAAAGGGPDAMEGVLVVRHGDDFSSGRTVGHAYFLRHDGAETELAFQGAPPDDSVAGQRIQVRGTQHGRQFLVAAGGTKSGGGSPGSGQAATGTRTVAVVLLNFSNSPTEPYTQAFATGIAFGNPDSVAAYYSETSWGQLTLTGQVFGWYTVPETNETCATGSWASSATAAAAAAGVDLGAYDHVVYAFPYVASCPWSGVGTMPGRTSFLNGPSAMALRTMAHELGHNFGTHHSSAVSCTSGGARVPLSSSCTVDEYGDPFSVMGGASRIQHTNFARANFGWLAKSNTVTASSAGSYSIAPVESGGTGGIKILRVPRGSTGTYFTLEFRQPSGTFDAFSGQDPVVTGVTIRLTGDLTTVTQSRLIDTTPATTAFTDAPLATGATFVDPDSGVSITTESVSSTGAAVRIGFGSATPTPSTSSTPSPSPTLQPTPTPSPTPDAQPPTVPGGLTATADRGRKVALSWTASSDNVGVAGYRVFRDGVQVAATTTPGYLDAVQGKSGPHTYYVVAYDRAGNSSPPSGAVTVTA